MQPNPGGQLRANQIVGRDQLVQEIWRALEQQSVVLTAERRIGKTSILTLLEDSVGARGCVIRDDVEGCHTAWEFAQRAMNVIRKKLPPGLWAASAAAQFFGKLGGTEVAGIIKLPDAQAAQWTDVLHGAMQDATKISGERVFILWDELPMMIDNIRRREPNGEQKAMQLLDILRASRQGGGKLRMVYTGSIGLHHVLSALRRDGYNNPVTNDMRVIEVPVLTPGAGCDLAESLLKGVGLQYELDDVPTAISNEVDHFPFYIHQVVESLRSNRTMINAMAVREVVARCISHAQDPWSLRHYEDRLTTYYGAAEAVLAKRILDSIACGADGPPQIINDLKAQGPLDETAMRETLKLLMQDHYITRSEQGKLSFKFSIVRRWWKIERGLP